MADQHILGYFVPYHVMVDLHKKGNIINFLCVFVALLKLQIYSLLHSNYVSGTKFFFSHLHKFCFYSLTTFLIIGTI